MNSLQNAALPIPSPTPHFLCSRLFILQYVVLPSTTGPFLPQAICCRCHVCFPLLFAKYYLFILRILVQLSSPKEVYGALKIAHYFAWHPIQLRGGVCIIALGSGQFCFDQEYGESDAVYLLRLGHNIPGSFHFAWNSCAWSPESSHKNSNFP